MLKVMTIVGTRPEIIRLSRVIEKLDRHCEHVLVHTGQNYDHELNQVFFDELGIRRPDHFLEAAGASAAETIGKYTRRQYGESTEIKKERYDRGVTLLCLNTSTVDLRTPSDSGTVSYCVETAPDGTLGDRARISISLLDGSFSLVARNY